MLNNIQSKATKYDTELKVVLAIILITEVTYFTFCKAGGIQMA